MQTAVIILGDERANCAPQGVKEGKMGQKQVDRDGRASAVFSSFLLLRVQMLYWSLLLTFSSNRSRGGSSVPRVFQHPQSVTKHSLSHVHKHTRTHAHCQHLFAPNVQCSWVLLSSVDGQNITALLTYCYWLFLQWHQQSDICGFC